VGSAEAGAVEALPRLGDLVTGKRDLDTGIALKLAASAGRHCTEAGGTRLWHSIVEVNGDQEAAVQRPEKNGEENKELQLFI
jgi:hypothetical protein